MPWLRWYDPIIPKYGYNPAKACQILYENGWRDSPDPNVATDVKFPPGHPLAGQLLKDVMTNGPHGASDPGLIFYRRSDRSWRSLPGELLIYGDATHKGLEDIGIPVDDNNVPRETCTPNVEYKKNSISTQALGVSAETHTIYTTCGIAAI
jgi:hypothetical protein